MLRHPILSLCAGFLLAGTNLVQAASGTCPAQSVVLRGEIPGAGGTHYIETVTLSRDAASTSMSGRWNMTRFTQDIIYPWVLRPPMNQAPIKTDMGFEGRWMNCGFTTQGTVLSTECTGGNYYLDVWDGKIGLRANGNTIGTVQGRDFQMRFGLEGQQQYNPILTGRAQDGPPNEVDLSVSVQSGDEGRHVFSTDTPAQLVLELQATTDPAELAEQVIWDIPEIPGSTRTLDPPTGMGAQMRVTYSGMPASNSAFGEKTVSASLDQSACPIRDSGTFKVYFPRDARNHPEPSPDWPNWLYYWKQTACGRPFNRDIGVVFAENAPNDCKPGVAGFYAYDEPRVLDEAVYLCNLPQTLGEDMKVDIAGLAYVPTAPTVQERFVYTGNDRRFTGIDTFGYTLVHEYLHYRNYARFWKPLGGHYYTQLQPLYDKDQDGIPDSMEPSMGFDPTKTLTYAPRQDVAAFVTYDEHWLVLPPADQAFKGGSCNAQDWAKPGKQWE